MQIKSIKKGFNIASFLIISSFVFTGCPSKISLEQQQELDELRRKESSINDEIRKTQREISKLKSELGSRLAELKDCNKDKDFVKQKLSQWPNVWPDWEANATNTEEGSN